jgi:hypothetical protein
MSPGSVASGLARSRSSVVNVLLPACHADCPADISLRARSSESRVSSAERASAAALELVGDVVVEADGCARAMPRGAIGIACRRAERAMGTLPLGGGGVPVDGGTEQGMPERDPVVRDLDEPLTLRLDESLDVETEHLRRIGDRAAGAGLLGRDEHEQRADIVR